MTNKQAQITINSIKFMLDHAQYSDDVEEALDMAINALTAQPETHACDCVSKTSVCEILADIYPTDGEKVVAVKEVDKAYEAIQQLPPAQPDTRSLEQIKWERDIAIQQLKDLGYSLGEKIRTDGDTISRQALMKEFADFVRRSNNSDFAPTPTWNDAVSLVGSMPSAQPEQRWIPSGKKPPEKGSYLVWMPFAPSKHRMTVSEYCGGYWNIKTPISAWMPLPEPYKEGTDD